MRGRSARVLEMAARPCGVTVAQVREHYQIKSQNAHSTLVQLEGRGKLHKAHAAGRCSHYFTTSAAASAWAMSQRGVPMQEPLLCESERAKLYEVREHIGSGPRRGVEPGRLPGSLDRGHAAGSAGWRPRVTVCPSAPVDARYQVAPGEKVWGAGFAALRPGQYIEPAHCLAAKAVA